MVVLNVYKIVIKKTVLKRIKRALNDTVLPPEDPTPFTTLQPKFIVLYTFYSTPKIYNFFIVVDS